MRAKSTYQLITTVLSFNHDLLFVWFGLYYSKVETFQIVKSSDLSNNRGCHAVVDRRKAW